MSSKRACERHAQLTPPTPTYPHAPPPHHHHHHHLRACSCSPQRYYSPSNLADTDVQVAAAGPIITAISDVEVALKTLEKNADGKAFFALLLEITDHDTNPDKLVIAVSPNPAAKVGATVAAVSGVPNTYKLTSPPLAGRTLLCDWEPRP